MHATRLATPADVDAVTGLVGAQLDDHDVGLARSTLRSAVARLVADASLGFVLVAEAEGEPIGVAVVATTWTLEHGGLVVWLDELYVRPERRGAGVGSALLDAATAEARSRGYLALELEVDAEHHRAERLYERAGFTRLPRRRFWLRLGERG